jgi:hypothetical protein
MSATILGKITGRGSNATVGDNLQNLLHKEMNRKEFLATIGFGVASIFGFSTIIKFLTGRPNPLSLQSQAEPAGRTNGFGASDYGNKRHHLEKLKNQNS